MTKETKQMVLGALADRKGDDFARAKYRFHGWSEAEMDTPYGFSGMTPRQILSEYEAHEKSVQAAIDEVKAL